MFISEFVLVVEIGCGHYFWHISKLEASFYPGGVSHSPFAQEEKILDIFCFDILNPLICPFHMRHDIFFM